MTTTDAATKGAARGMLRERALASIEVGVSSPIEAARGFPSIDSVANITLRTFASNAKIGHMPPGAEMPHSDIVVVTHFFPSRGGGIERVAARLVDGYLRAGLRVSWFASEGTEPPAPAEGLAAHPVRAWFGVERACGIPYPIWSPFALPRLWKSIRAARAVHVHEFFYTGSVAAILIARMLGRRIVLTQHAGEARFRPPWVGAAYASTARTIGRFVMGLASKVVFVSENVMRFFGRGRVPGRNRELVFNGVDTDVFRIPLDEDRQRVRAGFAGNPRAPIVLFAGRFVGKKGLGLVRELAEEAGDIMWIFAGAGPENPASWGLPNVAVLGNLSHPDLADAYGAADVLILPSSGEGFPLVVQEALACGTAILSTPEVASACPDAAGFIRGTELRLNDSDRARWLMRLREVLAEDLGDDARQRRSSAARALWSWERCTARYVDLLALSAATVASGASVAASAESE